MSRIALKLLRKYFFFSISKPDIKMVVKDDKILSCLCSFNFN